MLIGGYTVLAKSPGRWLGGSTVSDAPSNFGKSGPARARFSALGYLATSATPNAERPPASWVLAESSGAEDRQGLASLVGSGDVTGDLSATAAASAALDGSGAVLQALGSLLVSAVASLSGSGQITSAALSLVVQAVASLSGVGSVTANANATGAASSSLAGAGNVAAASLGALVSAIATLSGAGSMTAAVRADASVSASITPFTELSPQTLSAAVWAAVAADNAVPGTMGEALNAAGGGSTPSQVAAAVWDALRATSNDPGSMGQALIELFELMGLDPAKPLIVTPTTRDAGAALSQSIATVGTTTTVTRDP